jgi:hypothetical protein
LKTPAIVISILTIILGCTSLENKSNEEPLARVNDHYLYLSDVNDIFPSNLTVEDSLLIMKNFIDEWVKKHLLLDKAELNLTDDQKNVSRQVDDYRSSLLIFKYEQSLIKQKLDTIVTHEEIEKYYTENSSNFLLDHTIVKALFIKLPRDAPNLNRISQIYRSEQPGDIQQLEDYCYQYATKYDQFGEWWIPFERILQELPNPISNPERHLRYNNYIDQQDTTSRYLVYIKDYNIYSTEAPIEYVENNIRSIILNKRKVQFISDLENNVYNDALRKGDFEVY